MVTDRKEKIILGIVGKRASGKNIISNFLINDFAFCEIVFSDSIREILKILAIPPSRENLSWFITKMRKRFGEELLAQMAISKIEKMTNKVVICNGLRRKAEIVILKRTFKQNFLLLNLNCDDRARFLRIKKREASQKESKDKLNPTLIEFLKDEQSIETEKEIDEIQKMADYTIMNNGNFDDLKREVTNFVKKRINKK